MACCPFGKYAVVEGKRQLGAGIESEKRETMTTVIRKTYNQHPPGIYDAHLTEVTDKGMMDTPFGKRDQVELGFTSAAGKITRRYTKSLHPKANLNPVVNTFLNGQPLPEQLELERFIGIPVRIVVTLAPSKDGTRSWSRIDSVLPAQPPTYQPQPVPVYYPPQPPATAQSFTIPAPPPEVR
jgi:hypothetical protein